MKDIILLIISMAACLGVMLVRKVYMDRSGSGFAPTFLFNGLSCLVAAPVIMMFGGFDKVSTFTVLLGIGFGIVTSISAIATLKAISIGPVSYTTLICALSTVISALSGAMFFGETIAPVQIVGMILMLATFYLATAKGNDGRRASLQWLIYCLIAFICTGGVGVMQKVHQASEYKDEIVPFLVVMFLVSTVFSMLLYLVFRKKEGKNDVWAKSDKKTLVLLFATMAASGIFGALNNQFNLYLCGVIPAAIFFPIVNGGHLILTTLSALVFFKEKLTVRQWIGIGIGVVSVVLLCNPF